MEPRGTRLEASHEPIRDPLSGSLHAATSVRCLSTDFPTASVVRRKRRPPPWKSLATASHTEFKTPPIAGAKRETETPLKALNAGQVEAFGHALRSRLGGNQPFAKQY